LIPASAPEIHQNYTIRPSIEAIHVFFCTSNITQQSTIAVSEYSHGAEYHESQLVSANSFKVEFHTSLSLPENSLIL
jgi:hypothetical protein